MPINALTNNHSGVAPDKNAQGAQADAEKKTPKAPEEDQRTIQQLSQRDRDVRAHEAAHVAAAGQYVKGGATFQYQKGPDGKMYAVGGEVSIDTSPVKGDPQATIMKMEAVKRAALAPADPSGQDRSVASAAAAAEAQARQEAAKKTTNGNHKGNETEPGGGTKTKEPQKTASYTSKRSSIPFSKDAQTSLLNLLA
jgi:hypothetical protein